MSYGIIALLLANIMWGAGAPIFKDALTNVPPFTLAFFRFFGAALILLPFILHHKKHLEKYDFIQIFIGAFFGITINISFFFLGIQRVSSINAPILNTVGPILLFLLSVYLFKEKMRLKVLLGMLISLIGVLIIIFAPYFQSTGSYGLGNLKGNIFLIIGVFAAVVQPLILKNVLKKINPIVVTGYAFLFGAVTFIPLMLWETQTWSVAEINSKGMLGIIYGIIFSSVLAYGLFHYGVSKVKLQEVGIFTYISPVAAVIVGIFYKEYPTPSYFLGSMLTFLGIFISEEKIHYHKLHHHIEKK
ncbi:MAG TPA: DMT family transporter [Candidatus Nitrosocosmicus sp.]|nr:DMT family transporter [Candidatus Nitrosocosmicus sp.]